VTRSSDASAVEAAVDRALARHPGLRKTGGKMIFELRPDVEWDKDRAVIWLLRALGLEDALPVYIGDDETDEDAFRALCSRGISIAVLESPRDTAARYVLPDTDAVRQLLAALA
jgi:trehalose-phosphatase